MFTLKMTKKFRRGGEKYRSTVSLTSVLDGVDGQRHAVVVLPPGKGPDTHFAKGSVGPTAGLERC